MQAPVLHLNGVGKSYPTYRSNLRRFSRWVGLTATPDDEYWAIRDVSFSLGSGESLALIGQNGAGKSTLLKLIAGTVRPSTGAIGIAGRLSAMLELGLGFNPEFTGRENVFLAAGLMGIETASIAELLPSMEEFAELGRFFDQPLRMYSSGMQARLAFAVATALRPDILIIDEVLSVGDSYFQHKCFERIRSYREAGTSLIFVSHSMGDIRKLCDRVILIDAGRVVRDGPPDEIIDYYNALIAARENANLTIEQRRLQNDWVYTRSGSMDAVLRDLRLVDAGTDSPVQLVNVGQSVALTATIEVRVDLSQLVLGFLIRDKTGHVVWGSNTFHTKQPMRDLHAGDEVQVRLEFDAHLGSGSYAFSYALHADETHVGGNYEWVDNALVFDVANFGHPQFIGSSWLPVRFEVHP